MVRKSLALFLLSAMCLSISASDKSDNPEAQQSPQTSDKKSFLAVDDRPFPAELIIVEKDVFVKMSDNVSLCLNIFRPRADGRYPVILSITPYGKDIGPDNYSINRRMRTEGMNAGRILVSRETSFEAPDPAWWVPQGYAVAIADVRGFYKSHGYPHGFSKRETKDSAELIEWAASRPWSNGRVGLSGVSYLAVNQWYAAALNPAHLEAIMPWEGLSDPVSELLLQGGIPETNFTKSWSLLMQTGARRHNLMFDPGAVAIGQKYPALVSLFIKKPELEKITAPALVCGSWSNQGLHNPGSFRGFEQISSPQKWLYTHGGREWETYYGDDALAFQKKFFDHFLKGVDNGMLQVPAVRLEVRETGSISHTRFEPAWPLTTAKSAVLYLDPTGPAMGREVFEKTGEHLFKPLSDQALTFSYKFPEDTEITGYMRLNLRILPEAARVADVFVAVRKLDPEGNEVFFKRAGADNGPVAFGWKRVRAGRGKKPVLAEVEILPSSTLFRKGESIQLVISGRDIYPSPLLGHERVKPRGTWHILAGGNEGSSLELPIVAGTQGS